MPISELNDLALMEELAAQFRVDAIRATTSAGSGHVTSCMSAADLLAVLFGRHLRFDWDDPDSPRNDHLILSKGHAAPLFYAALKSAGVVTDDELTSGYRRFGQRLQGHPSPELPGVDVAMGSLGQGLPDGVGIALAGQYLDRVPYRVWVLCGDGEMAEGSVWEALGRASHYRLSNLIAVIDVNRLGQSGQTELGWHLDKYAERIQAFGALPIVVNGHDLTSIDVAMKVATDNADDGPGTPTVILAKTIKGRGIPEAEDAEGWHAKVLPKDLARQVVQDLGGQRQLHVRGPVPGRYESRPVVAPTEDRERGQEWPAYKLGDEVATREAYGAGLVALGHRDHTVVVLDAEVSNSTHAADFAKVFPDRYFEMYIAEQQMIAAATGLAVRGYRPYASTFAAFLSRAHDFIRMAAISDVDLRIVGSHCGVEIGADGPSQMALEDLGMMRAIHGSTVLCPSDATSTIALVNAMASQGGISYLRTTRGAYPVLYTSDDEFPIGSSRVPRSSPRDEVALIGCGVTVHQCLRAADRLQQSGISARVIDCYSIKPIDVATIVDAARVTSGRMIIAEDHRPEGGLGAAVISALIEGRQADLAVRHLAVRGMPGSGNTTELLHWAGIDAEGITQAALQLLEEW